MRLLFKKKIGPSPVKKKLAKSDETNLPARVKPAQDAGAGESKPSGASGQGLVGKCQRRRNRDRRRGARERVKNLRKASQPAGVGGSRGRHGSIGGRGSQLARLSSLPANARVRRWPDYIFFFVRNLENIHTHIGFIFTGQLRFHELPSFTHAASPTRICGLFI